MPGLVCMFNIDNTFVRGTGLHLVDECVTVDDSLPANIAGFEEWLLQSSLKESTRRVYLSRVRQFAVFLKVRLPNSNPEIKEFPMIFREFIAHGQAELGFKAATINNFLSTFRLFARRTGQLLEGVEYQTDTMQDRRHLTREERERYFAAARAGKSMRDSVYALLFLTTNITIGESVNLKVTDLIWEGDDLKLRIENGTRSRLETLGSELKNSMLIWLLERQSLPGGTYSEYLLCGISVRKLSTTSVDAVLRKIGWKAGLNVCSRVLRNTYRCLGPI